ncbi:MAG: hypothetical protein WC477_06965 [Patescibacteria group bacterium]
MLWSGIKFVASTMGCMALGAAAVTTFVATGPALLVGAGVGALVGAKAALNEEKREHRDPDDQSYLYMNRGKK